MTWGYHISPYGYRCPVTPLIFRVAPKYTKREHTVTSRCVTNQREGAALVYGDDDGQQHLMSDARGGPTLIASKKEGHHVDITNICLRQNEETERLLWQP